MSQFDYQYPTSLSLTEPPRRVPIAVRLRLLLGGYLAFAGWVVWGFGMIFFWVFALNSDISGWYDFSGKLETVQGTLTGSRKTNASVGGGEGRRGTPIYANDYRFEHQGKQYEGTSYKTGGKLKVGRKIDIQFPAGNPQTSRIVGMRSALFPAAAGLPGLIPFVGLILLVVAYIRNSRWVRLLKNGAVATGRLIESRPTNTTINDRRVYELIFEFTAEDGSTHQATARTHQTENLKDDQQEPLVYLPWNPIYATMLDHLPGGPKIDEAGEIRTDGLGGLLRVMILPLLVITSHAVYAGIRYM